MINLAGKERLQPAAQGVGGYDQNWYPVCLSTDVERDGFLHTPFLDGHVIVLRRPDGSVRVLSAYCRHLGASLRNATVEDGQLVCPFHAYRYDGDGVCVATGIGDRPPTQARLLQFPTHEEYGVVWAFNGESPLYDPPSFELSDLVHTASLDHTNSADHTVMFSNSCDIHHLRVLHGLDVGEARDFVESDFGMSYVQSVVLPGIGEVDQTLRLYGTNCITLERTVMGNRVFTLIAGKALPGNVTRTFWITAIRPVEGMPEAAVEDLVRQEQARTTAMIGEDDEVFDNIRFKVDSLTNYDQLIVWFLKYAASYPRSDWARAMIGR